MSPDDRSRRRRSSSRGSSLPPQARARPSPTDAHEGVYFRRHRDDDPGQREPGREALRSFPPVRAKMAAVLTAVATAPPHRFSGGGYWEAMHGEMTGYYEVSR